MGCAPLSKNSHSSSYLYDNDKVQTLFYNSKFKAMAKSSKAGKAGKAGKTKSKSTLDEKIPKIKIDPADGKQAWQKDLAEDEIEYIDPSETEDEEE
jgi:hypothetical protein